MANISNVETIARKLIEKKSVTPNDDGCQEYIKDELSDYGFKHENINLEDVKNIWLRKGFDSPLLVFAGHTDVVPPGNIDEWDTKPFEPKVKNNILYGRGASDMKSSISAMISAAQKFVENNPNHKGSIGFLLTSDEEGPAKYGTQKVIEKFKKDNIEIDYCIVGEPTSSEKFGDTIKNGRRGSLTGYLKIIGIQGHIAYPELAKNPIHIAGSLINELNNYKWDDGNKYFPKTSFQISSIKSDEVASNMIPRSIDIVFNLRFSSELTQDDIKNNFKNIISNFDCEYEVDWNCSAEPFITSEGYLTKVLQEAIKETVNIDSNLSTTGGTSDDKFISPHAKETLEFGPLNKTDHKINENIDLHNLIDLEKIYYAVLSKILL